MRSRSWPPPVALWFTLIVRGVAATIAAAALMGVAVCSMHYTGMYAMKVHLTNDVGVVPGVNVNWFLAPIVLFVLVVVIALVSAVMAVPSEREQAEAEAVRAKIAAGQAIRAAGPVFGGSNSGVTPAAAPAAGPVPGSRAEQLANRSKASQAFAARTTDARRHRGQ